MPWPKILFATVIGPMPLVTGWIDRASVAVATRPPTETFAHCMPTSPNPPSLNWEFWITPVFVGEPNVRWFVSRSGFGNGVGPMGSCTPGWTA